MNREVRVSARNFARVKRGTYFACVATFRRLLPTLMFDPLAHAERIEHSLEQAKVSLATQVLHQPDYHLSILTKLITELPADWGSIARMHVISSAGPCDLLRALTRDIEETKPEHESRFRIYTALLRLAIVIYRSDEHWIGMSEDPLLTPAAG